MPDDTRPTFGQALEAASTGSAVADAPATGVSPGPSEATGAPSAPTDLSDPASPATAATLPVAGDGSTTQAVEDWDPAAGPIPVDRHKAILENTRARARDEAQTQLQQEYGWALQMGPQNFQAVTNLAQQWANDPVAFVLGALDDLTASPEHAPLLRSHVAKLLARRPQNGNGQVPQAAPTDTPEPEPDIEVDGYSWYSAQKLAERDRWLSNKLLTQIRAELAPLREDMTSRQERDAIIRGHPRGQPVRGLDAGRRCTSSRTSKSRKRRSKRSFARCRSCLTPRSAKPFAMRTSRS